MCQEAQSQEQATVSFFMLQQPGPQGSSRGLGYQGLSEPGLRTVTSHLGEELW